MCDALRLPDHLPRPPRPFLIQGAPADCRARKCLSPSKSSGGLAVYHNWLADLGDTRQRGTVIHILPELVRPKPSDRDSVVCVNLASSAGPERAINLG